MRSIHPDGSSRAVGPYGARTYKSEGTSRMTYEIEPVGDSCRLIVTHHQLREGANSQLYGGWPMILSGIKTLLETGETLTTPGLATLAGAARPDSSRREDQGVDQPTARLKRAPRSRSRRAPAVWQFWPAPFNYPRSLRISLRFTSSTSSR